MFNLKGGFGEYCFNDNGGGVQSEASSLLWHDGGKNARVFDFVRYYSTWPKKGFKNFIFTLTERNFYLLGHQFSKNNDFLIEYWIFTFLLSISEYCKPHFYMVSNCILKHYLLTTQFEDHIMQILISNVIRNHSWYYKTNFILICREQTPLFNTWTHWISVSEITFMVSPTPKIFHI